jgi:hypothetical protein
VGFSKAVFALANSVLSVNHWFPIACSTEALSSTPIARAIPAAEFGDNLTFLDTLSVIGLGLFSFSMDDMNE